MNRQDVQREVKAHFGFVPEFINRIPDPHLEPMWMAMRDLQLSPGALPPQVQQLIMFAVSTYAKCKYCIDFHTEAARTLGATDREIVETALLTGHTAQFSNYLGGTQYDFDQFKGEVRAACKALKNGSPKPPVGRSQGPAPDARARGQ